MSFYVCRNTTMVLLESGVKTEWRITHELNEVKRETNENEEKRSDKIPGADFHALQPEDCFSRDCMSSAAEAFLPITYRNMEDEIVQ